MRTNLNKHGQDLYKTLQNLVKYNGGNFKSQKQADYLAKQREDSGNEMLKYWKFAPEHLLQDGEYYISISGEYSYGDGDKKGKGRGRVPFAYIYTMDAHGVKRVHHLKFKSHTFYDEYYGTERIDGWSPVGNELKWERTEVTFYPEEKTEVKQETEKALSEEKPLSEWVGTVGKRQQFTAKLTFRKWIDTAYGSSLLMAFTTEEGNILKTFYSGYNEDILDMEEGETYTFTAGVKEHSEYKGEKQTMIQRITKVKKAAVPV